MACIWCVISSIRSKVALSPDMCWKNSSFSICTVKLVTPNSLKMAVTCTERIRGKKSDRYDYLKNFQYTSPVFLLSALKYWRQFVFTWHFHNLCKLGAAFFFHTDLKTKLQKTRNPKAELHVVYCDRYTNCTINYQIQKYLQHRSL